MSNPVEAPTRIAPCVPDGANARTLLVSLVGDGIPASDTPKGPISLRFKINAAKMPFPGPFPET